MLLSGYVSSLKAYHSHSINKSTRIELPRKSIDLDKWNAAVNAAIRALCNFRDAETKRQTQHIDKANLIVEEAMVSLKHRYGFLFISLISNIFNYLSFNVI